ncbi:hypothetical protein TKK_0017205 [Trichogramma kaykai]|uniref:Lipid storage droplets surface-binding protein 1 n=1 Tax=Trichogramma kaykai TaxID=54128 RepID=A0ABD2W5Y6_9HYME
MTASTMEASQLPQVEVVHRVLELPMVGIACNAWLSTYSRVKDSNQLIHWTLSMAESSLTSATKTAAPYAKKLETPINFVDRNLCRGLDSIERNIPIVKETPDMILENAYMTALAKIRPAVSRINYANEYLASRTASIRDVSWNKMNELLGSQYGTVAVSGLDNTAFALEMLVDKYFPAVEAVEEKFPETVSAEEDRLLHTLQTVGRLSNKTARRVYANVVYRLRTLSKDNLRSFLSSLVDFLRLANYVQALDATKHQVTTATTTTTTTTTTTGATSPVGNGRVEESKSESASVPAAAAAPQKSANGKQKRQQRDGDEQPQQ